MKNIEIQNLFILATNGMSIVQTAYLKVYNSGNKILLKEAKSYTIILWCQTGFKPNALGLS